MRSFGKLVLLLFFFFDLRYDLITKKDPKMTTTPHAHCTLGITVNTKR